ncbi:hypothetical protein NC981_04295 [Leptolyngbya sp. DQ-M1]|uniref:hypothetical protein n=1 Tax=Leptolyngbya sp. DQ-M1 TaxID=2933920 RepID=UPI0032972381
MDRQQRELRRAAAQAFAESLNKLENTLCTPESHLAPEAPNLAIDFEQALADIERFMHEKEEQG